MVKSVLLGALFICIVQLGLFAQSATVASPPPLTTIQKASAIKINGDGSGFALGVKVRNAKITVDTAIRVNPKFVYLSIEMDEISGANLLEVMNGTNLFWVNDKAGKPIKIGEKFLKRIKGSSVNDNVEFVCKIPFKLKTDNNPYSIRFRWEGPDKKKVIDYVVVVK